MNGDILAVEAGAALLSAPPTLAAGSGLSGHFHREAGPKLEQAAKRLWPLQPGNSAVTGGYKLKAPLVIHAVAPRYLVGGDEEILTLRETYVSILANAALHGIKTIVFPAIGVGIYRWPEELAASIAISTIQTGAFGKAIICLYGDANFEAYQSILGE